MPCSPRKIETRPGFTLLELILAAGIATFVLGALLTSIDFIARTERSSTDKLDLARVAHSVFDRVERDLGVLVTLAEESDASELMVEADEELVEADDSASLSVIAGDDITLSLLIEPVGTVIEVADELLAWEELGGIPDGGSGPRRRLVIWGADPSVEPNEQVLRLATILASDGASGTDVGQLYVPEVLSMTFAYLIDGEWAEGCDDLLDGGPPAAIRVELVIQSVDVDGTRVGPEYAAERVFVVPSGRIGASSSTDEGEL